MLNQRPSIRGAGGLVKCDSDEERLDVFNGFLLAPHLDALFDGGWITFGSQGTLITSIELNVVAADLFGLDNDAMRLRWIESEHEPYLVYHRGNIFRG